MTVGEKIRKQRKNCRMSMSELGQRIGVTAAAVSRYELNQRAVSLDTLQQIAVALKVPISSLLNDDESYNPLQHGFKENLYYYRNLFRFSRNDLAEKTGIPAEKIKGYEDESRTIFVTENDLKILSICFNITPNDLKGHSVTQEWMIEVHSQNCIQRINDAVCKLNVLGHQKLAEEAESLAALPRYQRKPAENAPESMKTTLEGKDTTPDETPTETAHNSPEKD